MRLTTKRQRWRLTGEWSICVVTYMDRIMGSHDIEKQMRTIGKRKMRRKIGEHPDH